jgi:hypothetical protein
MSTKQTDSNKAQETPPRGSQSFSTADTVQQTKASPPESFPPPPRRPSGSTRSSWFAVAGLIVVLALVISLLTIALLQQRQNPATQVTPTPTAPGTTIPTTPGSDTTPTPPPGVTQGPQNGPASVSDPAYWDRVLGTAGTDRKVESVSFANILGNPTQQALVNVRHSNGTLDVYVFDKITNARPVQLFKLSGLIKGDAKISYYNSVMTAEVDRNSTLNAGKSSGQWTQDLFREFAWNDGVMSQVAFPGIFPDLTRWQAEADQAGVKAGHDTWKNDPAQVANNLVLRFFKWSRTISANVISGGGANDVYATVKVQEPPVQGSRFGPTLYVTLSRLEGNTHNMWVAIAVEDNNTLTIQNIDARSQITNPVNIQGTGLPSEADIGNAYVLDHLYGVIGSAHVTKVPSASPSGVAPYSVTFQYHTTFRGGGQEGIVYVTSESTMMRDDISSAVMIKVLLTPEPGVVQGPVTCPPQILVPGYWDSIIGIDKNIMSVGTPGCANMKDLPTLQAVVPVYHTDGSFIVDVYVYDNILDAHPVQLFKLTGLLHGGAGVSGYSTLLTQEVDKNSTVNTNKTSDYTVDLYREFVWSDGAGTFVQRAFPGFFPDLTRQQAELDQILTVNLGKDPWKKDAVQVAQRMAAQLLKWSPNAKASLLSGGGPQDVDAVVQVSSSNPGGMSINVTLSRLEGNTSNLWVVVGVTSGNGLLTINTPVKGDRLSSPATITGIGSAFEGVIGQAFVLDHLYTTIGQAKVVGNANGKTTYSVTVPYTSSFQGGAQEGIVVVNMYSQADSSIATSAMQKVMLG